MTFFAEWRARRIRQAVEVYAANCAAEQVDAEAAQLRRLNTAWQESLRRSPWARALRARIGAPARFVDWSCFERFVPIQRKHDVVATLAATDDAPSEPVAWRATGGTTAQPIRFPVFASEARIAELDHWLGRRRLGIDPADRLFLLWGHSHLFGSGLRGAIARARRLMADRALGYTRWSAYRMTEEELGRALEALLRSRARYVIGYSSALDRFARVNTGFAARIHALGLKAVIATAEAFPAADSRARVAECFGCPIVMEYGSVETGPVAYERTAGGYDAFFAHHRLERGPGTGPDGVPELLVTSLYPRALPLLRYAVGDLIETGPEEDGVKSFSRVIGRANDAVATPGGASIHSETFTHVLRDIAGIQAYQVVRGDAGVARRIRYEAAAPLSSETIIEIQRRLGLIDADLATLKIEHVERIRRSLSGKSVMVIDEA